MIDRFASARTTREAPVAEAAPSADSVSFPELQDCVTIRRDNLGIAYIDADNETDLYFAQGYATACDRLWQMDYLRRAARGELSEIFGRAALGQDRIHRVYGFTHVAEALFAGASTRTRDVLEAYARGVNAFISRCAPASLPVEFRVLRYAPAKWTTVDSLVIGKLLAESLSVSMDVDSLRALLPDLSPERWEELLPRISALDVLVFGQDPEPKATGCQAGGGRPRSSEEETNVLTEFLKSLRRSRAAASGDGEVGSNSWVVSGAVTASKKPLLANDPHLPAMSPSLWHIVHLSAPDLQVTGASLPGLPGVMIGHNNCIAWGITNMCPDVQDLYFEKFDEQDSSMYATPKGLQRAQVRREEIKVRNTDGTTEVVPVDVKVTRHGPIVFESGSLGLAMRWTALDAETIDLDSFLAINRARNWEEFQLALSSFGGPPQNFVYADTDGHIGYYGAGHIPIRRTGDGSFPYDGATDDGEWLGFIPFAELPHVFDPPSGVIVTANNRLAGDDYPHHLTHNWRVPYRARRIHELLMASPDLTVKDFLSIQGDTYTYPDLIFTQACVSLGKPLAKDSSEWREIVDTFAGWDGYAKEDATVLPLAVNMRQAFRDHILAGVLGAELAQLFEWRNEGTFLDKLIIERSREWLPQEFESYDALLLACYREARGKLTKKLGADPANWIWGSMEFVRFPHPLEKIPAIGSQFAVEPFPQNTGGSMPTVNAGSRVSLRFIANLSNWDDSRFCLPLGESGDPASVHRTDQLSDWRAVTSPALPFQANSVAEAARNVLVLRPG